jgi:Plasma-membrane choline transporter
LHTACITEVQHGSTAPALARLSFEACCRTHARRTRAQFINKNAYIQTALFSTSFCKSAREGFYLIARNIARIGAVSLVSEFLVIIMKLLICLACMGSTYLGLNATVSVC